MRARSHVISILFLTTAILRADAQSLEGTWVTVLDVNGAVFPHIEELRIGPDGGVRTAIYGIRDIPECDGKPSVRTGACAPEQPNAAGQLAIDNARQTIAISSLKLANNAMTGIGNADDERLARDVFWFGPGEPWTFRREGATLLMSRQSRPVVPNTEVDGTKLIVTQKRFFAADTALAGDLIAFAIAGEYSLVKLVCLMPFITSGTAPAGTFRELIRDVATVARKQQDLFASTRANATAAAVATFRQTLSTLRANSGAVSAADIAAAATALGVTVAQVERFVREIALRRQQEPVDALLFPVLRSHEVEIRACHKRYFE